MNGLCICVSSTRLWSCKKCYVQCSFALCILNPFLDLEIFPQITQEWETLRWCGWLQCVSLCLCPDPFLSTHITCTQSSCLISNGQQMFSDIHHGADLFVQFFSNNFDLIGVWCLCWVADVHRLWHIWNWFLFRFRRFFGLVFLILEFSGACQTFESQFFSQAKEGLKTLLVHICLPEVDEIDDSHN